MIDFNGFNLPQGIAPAQADERFAILAGREDAVPAGDHCYTRLKPDPDSGRGRLKLCPYWAWDDTRVRQENGYCALLKRGDWQDGTGTGLLREQIKACGINAEGRPPD